MSFLGLGGGGGESGEASIPAARVLVVGDAGCGKTSLVHALVHGRAPARPTPTLGCSVLVKLLEVDSGPSTPSRDGFIELWDVGGGRRSAPLRRLFYQDVAGVVLCHDLSVPRSRSSARAWAAEILKDASFRGALGGAGAGAAGLPVPVLLVGTKRDAAPRGGRRGGGGPLGSIARWVAQLSPERSPATRGGSFAGGVSPPPTRGGLATATTAAAAGDVDAAAFDDFFRLVLTRRLTGGAPSPAPAPAPYAAWGSPDRGGGAEDAGLGDEDDLV